MSDWSHNEKVNTSVLASGITASFVAPGAVFCVERIVPGWTSAIKRMIAKHIVEPNLPLFETFAKGLTRAHERYDERKRQQDVAPEDAAAISKHERAYAIADAVLRGSMALTADYAATVILQKMLNKKFGVSTHPHKVAMMGTAVHLGGIAVMPTLLAGVSENIHYSISKLIRKVTGMNKRPADDIAMPFTYITLPGIAGVFAELAAGRHFAKR